jgi:hypothetical protein
MYSAQRINVQPGGASGNVRHAESLRAAVGWSVLIAQGVSFILFRFRHSLQAMPRMNWTRSIARVFPAKDRDADAVRSLIITRLREKEIPHARRQMDY